MATDPAFDAWATRFAADLLGIAPDVTGQGPLGALLRRLDDHDLLPDPLAHEALLALAGRPAGPLLRETAAEAERRRLTREIHAFAGRYFDEPVEARAKHYRALVEACAGHPGLLARLEGLAAGLAIERSAVVASSPTVRQLLDDILTLYPLDPASRAREARRRSSRFLSEPALGDAERARALKTLARRHPGVRALVPDYLKGLVKPRRRATASGDRSGLRGFLGSSGKTPYVIIAAVVLSSMGRLVTPTPPRPSDVRAIAVDAAKVDQGVVRFVRERLETTLGAELARIGRPIEPRLLARIVAGLPVEKLASTGELRSIAMTGRWSPNARTLFSGRLRASLIKAGVPFNEPGLGELDDRCFPTIQPGQAP
jgi:hypothetical protein